MDFCVFFGGFFLTFAVMKRFCWIGIVVLLALVACHTPTREARRMIARAERLADTLPDSTARLIDSVLRMPVYFSERQRMDMALLQAEALFGDRGNEFSPVMDDDFFDDKPFLSTSPDLERAAAYYSSKKQYTKAAHAALYSGFVQQHYNEKEAAMRSFKEAEQYGGMVQDSFTVALAEYRMGKMLIDDGMEQEALAMLQAADKCFGDYIVDKALTINMMAICYMLQKRYNDAEANLKQSLNYTEKEYSSKARRKILNNQAVLCRLQGKYEDAIEYLNQMVEKSTLDTTELFVFYLNVGKTFVAANEMDSATLYFKHVESLLSNPEVKMESRVSACGALSRFAEQQENIVAALQYKEQRENLLSEVLVQRQKQAIYRIQQQYDYESLQNEMNKKLIQRQHVITFFGVVVIIGLGALAVSQIRLAKTRKQEAEAKISLFHFMQQNKELAQKHESSERALADLSMMHKADEKAYQDLIRKNFEIESACNTYAQQLSDALNKEALTMRKLDIFLKNKEEKAYLAALKDAVFNNNEDHWEALMGVFDLLYPDVRSNLALQHPELTEMEQKDFILSYFNVSRDEEARLFQKSIHTVDKLRYTVRQKMKQSTTESEPKSCEKA